MEDKIAQAAPGNGASNASDFQPTTQNPQTGQSSVQAQTGLQGVTNPQEFLSDNQNVQISVPTNPAPAQAQVKSDATGLIIIAIIAIVIAIILFKISSRIAPRSKITVRSQVANDAPIVQHEDGETKVTRKKRKPTKKTKRRNR